MKFCPNSLGTLRKLIQALADPKLNEDVEALYRSHAEAQPYDQLLRDSSMYTALSQMGLLHESQEMPVSGN